MRILKQINKFLYSLSFLIPDAVLVVAIVSIFLDDVRMRESLLLVAIYLSLAIAERWYRENVTTDNTVKQVNDILTTHIDYVTEALQDTLEKIEGSEEGESNNSEDEMGTTQSKESLQ